MRGGVLLVLLFTPAWGAEADPLIGTWKGHTSEVGSVVFTPDGGKVLSASDDKTLKLWDLKTGEVLATWKGHSAEVGSVCVTPDGRKVVSGSEDRTIRIWDIARGKETSILRSPSGQVRTLKLSPDGRLAAVLYYDGELKLWDIETGAQRATLNSGEAAHLMDIAYSPDGRRILTGRWDKTIGLWDIASGRRLALWHGHEMPVITVAFSPDGTRALSGSRDNTVRLWDVAAGKTLAVWKGHTSYVYAVAFSPDGRTALSGGADYTLRRWDVATGRELSLWRGHQGDIRSVAFSPDGSLAVSASDDSTIKLWDIAGTHAPAPLSARRDGGSASPDGTHTPQEKLGRILFFDRRLSGDNTLSCAVCHVPAKAFTDGLALSLGYPDTLYFRNTPTLLNAAAQSYLYWDGRFPAGDITSLVRDHIAEAHFMNADGRLIIEKLRQAPGYVEAFQTAYGAEPSYENLLLALTEFLQSLESGESLFDKDALSAEARRGYALFNGAAGCVKCHSGPLLSDGRFYARGAPENPEVFKEPLRRITFRRFFKLLGLKEYAELDRDPGLYAVTKNPQDKGKFKTPSLREVARTAPYMHNGVFKTLEEVVRFESPLLSPPQRKDIAAFLRSLEGKSPVFEPPALPEYAPFPPAQPAPIPLRAEPLGKIFPPLRPLPPVPVPEDNPLSPEKIELGSLLFFDLRLSGNGETYCASCHEPEMGWGDDSDLSQGYEGTLHWRNTQTLLNAAYFSNFNWDAGQPSLEEQARAAITSNMSANGDPAMIEERLAEVPEYVARFEKVFGVKRPTFEGVLKAIASFERAVPISRNVPFDAYARGDSAALSPSAVKGLELFTGKAGCIRCHNGPLASDQKFYATGVPRNPAFDQVALRQVAVRFQHVLRGVPEDSYRDARSDPGLYLTTLRPEDIGKFRTPSLRELKVTAPYMHNGVFATLSEVLDFYDGGGPLLEPLHLSRDEKKDLLSFLESLSGDRILIEHPTTPGSHRTVTGYP